MALPIIFICMKVNYNKITTICIFFIFSFSVIPQERIDNIKFRANYLFLYKTDLEQEEFAKTDLMFLDIGESVTKFYSRYEQIRDSVSSSGIKEGLFPHEIVENMRNFKKGVKTVVYNFMSNNKFHTTEGLVDYYHYDEERMLPTWEIVQDKKEIAGYICQKASTNYLGREWIVYFTPEIPINQGPWKLWGLPGLIVEARDKDNLFSFELDGFEVVKKEVPILYKNADSTGKLYTAISKKKFQELEKLYYKDFLEYLKVFVMDGKGSLHQTKEQKQQYQKHKRKGGIPYIPLEPY